MGEFYGMGIISQNYFKKRNISKNTKNVFYNIRDKNSHYCRISFSVCGWEKKKYIYLNTYIPSFV